MFCHYLWESAQCDLVIYVIMEITPLKKIHEIDRILTIGYVYSFNHLCQPGYPSQRAFRNSIWTENQLKQDT